MSLTDKKSCAGLLIRPFPLHCPVYTTTAQVGTQKGTNEQGERAPSKKKKETIDLQVSVIVRIAIEQKEPMGN